MTEAPNGWAWFERAAPSSGNTDAERALSVAYARCFSGPHGERVLAHLRALTVERALGPDASAELLRHTEGQRQLVHAILALVERGRAATPAA